MDRELALTVALYAMLIALAIWGGPFGTATAIFWIGIGIWMVSRSHSRGWVADVSFVVTWPIYVALGR